MPYKFEKDKTPLPLHKDRRRKLSPDQIVEIRASNESLRVLSTRFNVSRRTIQFYRDPQKLAENKLRRLERGGWRQYYDKQQNTDSVREHRRHKQSVMQEIRQSEIENQAG